MPRLVLDQGLIPIRAIKDLDDVRTHATAYHPALDAEHEYRARHEIGRDLFYGQVDVGCFDCSLLPSDLG